MTKLERFAAIATIIGVVIAAIALIPDFGQWLFPYEPSTISESSTSEPNTAQSTTPRPTTSTNLSLEPIPTLLSPNELLTSSTYIFDDTFDTLSLSYWKTSGDIQASNSLVTITGYGDWVYQQLMHRFPLKENFGSLFLFRFGEDAQFGIRIQRGDYGEQGYRGLGLLYDYHYDEGGWQIVEDSSNEYIPIISYQPNVWYYLYVAVDQEGKLEALLWEANHPEKRFHLTRDKGEEWSNLSLYPVVPVASGVLQLDEYHELELANP